MERKVVSPDSALASDIFDQFCNAATLKSILTLYRRLIDTCRLRPTNFPHFYPKLKNKLRSWRAQALWTKFDKRASHKCYARGHICANSRVLIIGAGPCGLRAAVEAQLLGAKVVVVEKRDRITRNNVLHLWPFVIHDLRALGAKKFFGKFCAGSIDHISIRQLQVMLLKVALLLGVEVHIGVGFEKLVPPPDDQTERVGWKAEVSPADHPVSQYEFDVLIGADGKRNTLEGFGRKEFRGKLAIAITANFLNRRSEAEARVEEISGVAFIFNQKFFKDLYQETGIDLENIVYYKDDTHYFVMTAKKTSLIEKGVIISDQNDTARLLSPDNVNKDALMEYAREAADFSTKYQLPVLEFAVNHYGQPDVAMFDFTSMYAAENASKILEKNGHRLLMQLVGDSLLEPFWPTGSGCARGFLSSMDSCWALRSWGAGLMSALEVAAERESIYRLLGQTTPENLSKDFNAYTLEPHTRYPNLNLRAVLPIQVRNLINTDNPASLEILPTTELPTKRRRKESQVHPDTLLQWLKRQVALYDNVKVENMSSSFRDGMALCAIINRYRPDLIDFSTIKPEDAAQNNQLAFDILNTELNISPVMSGAELASRETPDHLTMLSYLSQVYDAFRGEIPHLRTKTMDEIEEVAVPAPRRPLAMRVSKPRVSSAQRKRSSLERGTTPENMAVKSLARMPRKRRSHDKDIGEVRRAEIEANREERADRRRMIRHMTTQRFVKSMQMLQAGELQEPSTKYEDFSITVYRQHAPLFTDRVKQMEKKLLYSDRESRIVGDVKRGGPDENFSSRIKEIEMKFKGTAPVEKKPRDLHRAIGKIESSDWNVAVIERKMEENKMGKSKAKGAEKVPKWSREKFADKFSAVEKKLRGRSKEEEAEKFANIDKTLKQLDRKIKEGSVLDPSGPRGANKVSAMAEQLATKLEPTEVPVNNLQKSSSKSIVLPQQGGSESCHFCAKRVYLMERLSAEGRFFHRGCFRCEYCATSLRPNNYAFDRDGKYGSRFVCTQHYGLPGFIRAAARARRKSEDLRAVAAEEARKLAPSTPSLTASRTSKHEDQNDSKVGATPERVEFENLATGSDDDLSEVRPASGQAEMDEEAWTDHNFGASCADDDSSSDEEDSSLSDSDDNAEAYEEAMGEPLSVEETRQLAETWKRRYSQRPDGINTQERDGSEISDDDIDSSEEEWSCDRDDLEDEDSSTATEGDAVARELLRQEERLRERVLRRHNWSKGSDTEVNIEPCNSGSNIITDDYVNLDISGSNFEQDSGINSMLEPYSAANTDNYYISDYDAEINNDVNTSLEPILYDSNKINQSFSNTQLESNLHGNEGNFDDLYNEMISEDPNNKRMSYVSTSISVCETQFFDPNSELNVEDNANRIEGNDCSFNVETFVGSRTFAKTPSVSPTPQKLLGAEGRREIEKSFENITCNISKLQSQLLKPNSLGTKPKILKNTQVKSNISGSDSDTSNHFESILNSSGVQLNPKDSKCDISDHFESLLNTSGVKSKLEKEDSDSDISDHFESLLNTSGVKSKLEKEDSDSDISDHFESLLNTAGVKSKSKKVEESAKKDSDSDLSVNFELACLDAKELGELSEFLDDLGCRNVNTEEALKPSELFNRPPSIRVNKNKTREEKRKEMESLSPMLCKTKISDMPSVSRLSDSRIRSLDRPSRQKNDSPVKKENIKPSKINKKDEKCILM